jgi:hypothetical protein
MELNLGSRISKLLKVASNVWKQLSKRTAASMLVVFTQYDPVTAVLSQIARDFVSGYGSQVSLVLGSPESDAAAVQQLLNSQEGVAVLFFGHGCPVPASLIAQDRQAAIHAGNLHLLQDRLICAFACHSWEILQADAGSHGYSVLGYEGPLQVPLRPKYYDGFRRCLFAGPQLLLAGKLVQEASDAAAAEFEAMATQLIQEPAVADKVMASLVFRPNSRAARWAGLNRTL